MRIIKCLVLVRLKDQYQSHDVLERDYADVSQLPESSTLIHRNRDGGADGEEGVQVRDTGVERCS